MILLPQEGGCVCAAVRYQLSGRPLVVYACHCHDCQSRSGAAFTLNMVIHFSDLSVSGPLSVRQVVKKDGRGVEQTWCDSCGAIISARALSAPDYATLMAGTLDDASWVRPVAQTFVESAIPWAVISNVRVVPWAEFDFVSLGREWAASAPPFGRKD